MIADERIFSKPIRGLNRRKGITYSILTLSPTV